MRTFTHLVLELLLVRVLRGRRGGTHEGWQGSAIGPSPSPPSPPPRGASPAHPREAYLSLDEKKTNVPNKTWFAREEVSKIYCRVHFPTTTTTTWRGRSRELHYADVEVSHDGRRPCCSKRRALRMWSQPRLLRMWFFASGILFGSRNGHPWLGTRKSFLLSRVAGCAHAGGSGHPAIEASGKRASDRLPFSKSSLCGVRMSFL